MNLGTHGTAVQKYVLVRTGLYQNRELLMHSIGRMKNTRRISWMANNAMPDSIMTNMTCRSLLPPVESKVSSAKIGLTSKNTLRILKTIKPVTRAFTTMDAVRPVISITTPQWAIANSPCTNIDAPSCPSQVARGDRLNSTYQMNLKIGWLT